jgi:hypothetical protein
MTLQADDIEALFTRQSGDYLFARWGRPIAPVVFGVEDSTLAVIKGAFEAVVALANHKMAETDPELGANCMVFFFRDWQEVAEVPQMEALIPDFDATLARLQAANANQYRVFRFDEAGGIKACFIFLRMDEALLSVPVETLSLVQVVQSVLLWSDTAFHERSALHRTGDGAMLRPDIAALIRAAYDPVMPVMSADPSHALRLAARLGPLQ